MPLNVLYYPSISIPNTAWLRSVILYVDKIGSIVPYDYQFESDTNQYARLLREVNQYEPLSPEQFMCDFKSIRAAFEDEVLETLRSKNRTKRRPETPSRVSQVRLIHKSKFTYQIHEFMRLHGLMEEMDYEWNRVDDVTADIYMHLLAKHMAFAYNYVPATDNKRSERQSFSVWGRKYGYQVGFLELLGCLPVPKVSASLEDILELKSRRSKELRRFQGKLLEFQSKLAGATSLDELNYYKNVCSNEVEVGLAEIQEYFGESRIDATLVSLRSLFEMRSPALLSVGIAGVGIADFATTHPVQATLTVSGITVGTLFIATRLALKRKLLGNPFSYVFHANKVLR